MVSKLSFAGMIILCSTMMCDAQTQHIESHATIRIIRLDPVKLVDRNHHAVEIEVKISLQTSGIAISSVQILYRHSADAQFQQSECELLPNLTYYVKIPYSPEVEYYFVATPFSGGLLKFGEGSIIAADLESHSVSRSGSLSSEYVVVGGAAGVLALITSVLANSDQPAISTPAPKATKNSPALYVGVAALAGGVTASIIYWRNRHSKHKERLADHRHAVGNSESIPFASWGTGAAARRACGSQPKAEAMQIPILLNSVQPCLN